MFKKKNKDTESTELNKVFSIQAKYLKPKIMLIDLPPDALSALKQKGYNVILGSFGHPYKVKQNSYNNKVLTDAKLPNYTEQEIIVIDLSSDIVNRTTEREIPSDYKDTGLCTEKNGSIIDPRPLAMIWRRHDSERIINHGGIFIIFAEPRENWTYYDPEDQQMRFTTNNWSFLSCLDTEHIAITQDNGYEIQINDTEKNFVKSVLSKHTKKIEFSCILERTYEIPSKNWCTFASNKFGQIVSAVILINTENKKRPSWVLISHI